MNILYSIPVHECAECIQQLCDGIFYYEPDAYIVLHVSDSQSLDFYKPTSDRVIINPTQFETRWGWDLSRIHVSNYLFAKQHFTFDYIVYLTSNCLMIKSPKQLISNYDCGFSEHVHHAFKITPPELIEERQLAWAEGFTRIPGYTDILNELNTTRMFGGIIDGSYANVEIMDRISELYIKHFNYKTIYASLEEVLFATIACNMTTNVSDALLWLCDQNLDGFKSLPNKDGVYFNKRIPRDINNEIRQYYNTLIK
jgi:hypothetical protein